MELIVGNHFKSGKFEDQGCGMTNCCELVCGCDSVAMVQDRVKWQTLALMASTARVLLPRGYLHSNMCSVSDPQLKEHGPMVAQHTMWCLSTSYTIWGSRSCGYGEFHLLEYSAFQSAENQPKFRRNMSPPSSGSKNKSSKKPVWCGQLLQTGFQYVGLFSADFTGLYPRRWNSI
jgi:hypothetical protein